MRGLPEMNISDIYLSDVTVKAEKGIDIQEAKNIQLNNIQLKTSKTAPLIYINNGSKVSLSRIGYEKADVLMEVSGANSGNITVTGTDVNKAAKKLLVGTEVSEKAVNMP